MEKHATDITLQRQSLSHSFLQPAGNEDIQQHLAHQYYPFLSRDIVINTTSWRKTNEFKGRTREKTLCLRPPGLQKVVFPVK